MMRPVLISLVVMAGPAQAFPCVFSTECYEVEPCSSSDFGLDVNIDEKTISTDYGNLTIVAVKETGRLTTLFATGQGAEYLLSLSPRAARLSTHANDGPQAITYLGTCEGAF